MYLLLNGLFHGGPGHEMMAVNFTTHDQGRADFGNTPGVAESVRGRDFSSLD